MIGMGTTIFLVNPQTFPSSTSYLLDTYSAAAAYSLRQLKTGVTSVVRVRRSSDNAGSDFTADEITDGTLVTWTGANDGFVTTWYDQSGGGNDVTQSTAGNQPRLVASGVVQTLTGASGNALTWGIAGSQLLNSTALTELNSGNDFSIFAVARQGNNASQAIVSTQSTSSASRYAMNAGADGANGRLGIIHNGTTAYNANVGSDLAQDAYLFVNINDGTAKGLDGYYNGNGAYSVTWTGTYTNNTLQIGVDRNNQWEATLISEVIIFGTDESANRTDIESDINTYYSIY